MLGRKGIGAPLENSALPTADAHAARSYNNQRKIEEKSRVWCDYCNKPCHAQDTCWKLHGKPANMKGSFGTPSANKDEASFFTKEQVDQLLKLLKPNPSSGIPSGSPAYSGSTSDTLTSTLVSTPWIIDSGCIRSYAQSFSVI